MSLFSVFCSKFVGAMHRQAAMKVHQHLLAVDPGTLEKAGISRQLLDNGPSAYPWRTDEAVQATKALVTPLHAVDQKEAVIRAAIAELQAYSNVELADLGITRGEIAYAVRNGREGIDNSEAAQRRKQAA